MSTEQELLAQLAHSRHAVTNHYLSQLEEEPELAASAAAEASYDCNGTMDVSAVVVRSSVDINDLLFDVGGNVCFEGSGWGIGLGATGSSPCSGTFNVDPTTLVNQGKVKYQLFFLSGGIGGTEISFWNESLSEYLGVVYGGNIGLGGASTGGDGSFRFC